MGRPLGTGEGLEDVAVRRAAGRLRRPVVALALAVVAATVGGCGLLPSEPVSLGQLSLKIPAQPPPATLIVRRGTVASTVQIAGQVASTRTAALYFPIAGRVASMDVHDGEAVKKGQLLASLDSGGLIYQIQAAQLTVQQDRMNIENLHIQDQAAPPSDADQATQQSLALAGAELALRHDTQSLQSLQQQYAQNEIVAPFAGQVSGIGYSLGDQVAAFQPVLTVSDPSRQALIATIGNQTASQLHQGERVRVRLNSSHPVETLGTIASLNVPSQAEINQVEQSTNGNVVPTPTLTVALPAADAAQPLGETFSGLIILGQAKHVLYVPSDAVRALQGKQYVDIFAKGVVQQVPVTTGLQGDSDTVVLSGLKQGEHVIQP